MIRVLPFNQPLPENAVEVDTTSRSKTWSRGLSPFLLGPVELWGGHVAQNVENAWQYSKVYSEHLMPRVPGDSLGPGNVGMALKLESWLEWAKAGWATKRAVRYPMGKGREPAFSYWDGARLDYVTARRTIYIPLYWNAVRAERYAFELLVGAVHTANSTGHDLVLRDFDAYDHHALAMTYADVVHCTSRKMGHAFVLAMMLKSIGLE